jgi:hypothetical protein
LRPRSSSSLRTGTSSKLAVYCRRLQISWRSEISAVESRASMDSAHQSVGKRHRWRQLLLDLSKQFELRLTWRIAIRNRVRPIFFCSTRLNAQNKSSDTSRSKWSLRRENDLTITYGVDSKARKSKYAVRIERGKAEVNLLWDCEK